MDPHYSAAWAWAGNTPFQWGKQVGSHLGGTRNPMVVHWPARITGSGGLRSQFTHVIDVAPTILDVAGIPAPTRWTGSSRSPSTARPSRTRSADAAAPERHTQQYFETIGNRAMYKDGWWLAMRTARIPWVVTPDALRPYAPGVWDPGQPIRPSCTTCPTTSPRPTTSPPSTPDKVAGAEGAVLGRGGEVQGAAAAGGPVHLLRHPAAAYRMRSRFEFRGDVQNVLSGMIPRIYNHSYAISADLVVPDERCRRA